MARSQVRLLGAPILRDSQRFGDKPLYASDLVVRADSNIRCSTQLKGATFGYNGSDSLSGYHCVRFWLQKTGRGGNFFGRTVKSGSHHKSIELLVSGKIDCVAIDATVSWRLSRDYPEMMKNVRTLVELEPYPVQPWLVSSRIPKELENNICDALVNMHLEKEAKSILAVNFIRRFVGATRSLYRRYDALHTQLHSVRHIDLRESGNHKQKSDQKQRSLSSNSNNRTSSSCDSRDAFFPVYCKSKDVSVYLPNGNFKRHRVG